MFPICDRKDFEFFLFLGSYQFYSKFAQPSHRFYDFTTKQYIILVPHKSLMCKKLFVVIISC